ncbi:BTAD domain-containing putative transcriptional regulator [Streptomyces wuyuanensis]|uniref:BTAD domain-containing putative transcriptional regulator n=1 Tax=Streptomyces wuyuanensis TaxID=1196353 RepID=UPI0037F3A7F3
MESRQAANSAALAVFTKVRRRLVRDQGTEPDGELRRVHEAVLRADAAFLLGVPPRPHRTTDGASSRPRQSADRQRSIATA